MGFLQDLSGESARKDARRARNDAKKAAAAQEASSAAALAYAKEQDATKLGYATDWYDEQRGLADAEDERRFGLLPQFMDNATSAFDEAVTGADDYSTDILGNADRMYDELTGNARYTGEEYQVAGDEASADVVQAFDKARGMTRRNAMRYGMNPNSSDYARMETSSALDQAKADAGAQNTTRRGMKREERGRLADAIGTGLTARGNALSSGYGARDSATRYGRGMVQDALNTNLNTRSSKIGLIDPRTGLTSMTLNQMNNQTGMYGNRYDTYNQNAQNAQAQAQGAMSDLLGAAAGVGGAMAGKPPLPV